MSTPGGNAGLTPEVNASEAGDSGEKKKTKLLPKGLKSEFYFSLRYFFSKTKIVVEIVSRAFSSVLLYQYEPGSAL